MSIAVLLITAEPSVGVLFCSRPTNTAHQAHNVPFTSIITLGSISALPDRRNRRMLASSNPPCLGVNAFCFAPDMPNHSTLRNVYNYHSREAINNCRSLYAPPWGLFSIGQSRTVSGHARLFRSAFDGRPSHPPLR